MLISEHEYRVIHLSGGLLLSVVRDKADECDKIWAGCVFVQLLLDVDADVGREDFHQRLGGQLAHGVVLDRAAREV